MKHVLLTVVFLGIACVAMAHELLSPNGNLKLNVVLDSEGGPVYSLYYKGEPVVEPSALGILMEEADLSNGFRILDATNSTFDETWMPVWGEYEKVRNHYNELTVTLSQPAKYDRTMIVRFRLFDDGLGFRYELPEQKNMNYLTVIMIRMSLPILLRPFPKCAKLWNVIYVKKDMKLKRLHSQYKHPL